MIICVCNALNDKQLKDACANCPNAQCAGEEVLGHLGRKPVCGQCLCYIEDVLLPSRAATHPIS